MKMMHESWRRASLNSLRILEAPTPAYISTKSEPLANRNGTFASPAIERASSVLPVPGGPDEQNAFRNASADRRKARRVAQEIDNLLHFLFRFVNARDVGKRHRRLYGIRRVCLAFERRDAPGGDAIQGDAEHADEADPQDECAVAERVLFGRGANVDADVPPRQIGDEAGIQRDVVGRRVGPGRLPRRSS